MMPNQVPEDAPVFVISVAAQLSGMHPQTLRTYDRLGLVNPDRTPGGGRRYSARDIVLLREIARLSAEGVNLAGIKRIIELTHQTEGLTAQVQALVEKVEASLRRLPAAAGATVAANPGMSMATVNVIEDADDIARDMGDQFVATEHLVVALAKAGETGQWLREAGATPDALVKAFPAIRGGNRRVTSQNPEDNYQALEKYGVDPTDPARSGKLGPVIGPDTESRPAI